MVEEKFLTELQSQLDFIKARTKHLRPVAEHSSTNEPPVERSLRSVAANSSTVKESLDWNNLIKEKDKVVPARRQKVPNPNTTTMLEPKLDEKDVRYVKNYAYNRIYYVDYSLYIYEYAYFIVIVILISMCIYLIYLYRSDFLHIVKDLEQRAGNYSKRVPPPTTTAPTATTNGKSTTTAGQTLLPSVKVDAVGRLVVNDKTFTVGDAIEVYSLLSDESFVGSITVIDSEEVILRSEAGPRFSFPISVIKSGRLVFMYTVIFKRYLYINIVNMSIITMYIHHIYVIVL